MLRESVLLLSDGTLIISLGAFCLGTCVFGWIFAHVNFLIPVERLRETPTLMAFYHPKPSYRIHILIVPKRALASLQALSPADADFMVDLFAVTQSLVSELGLERIGYRLIANGGAYQDVPQLHFHLISEGK